MLKKFLGLKMLKKIFRSKKPVFRSKTSKNQELGLKKQVIDVKSQKNYRRESLSKYTRKKDEADRKKKVNQNFGGK